jgi:hypothetical protein
VLAAEDGLGELDGQRVADVAAAPTLAALAAEDIADDGGEQVLGRLQA